MSNARSSDPSPGPHRPGLPARLLLVFEDSLFLHSLSQFLTQDGFHVEAAHPSEALARLAAAPCQLLLADVDSGLHLLRRTHLAGMPLIIIAGYDMLPSARQAVQMGAFAFLIKPIIDDELRLMIHRGLQTPRPPAQRWQPGLPLDCTDRWRHRQQTARLRKPPASV